MVFGKVSTGEVIWVEYTGYRTYRQDVVMRFEHKHTFFGGQS
jgi:hypothetical protein